MFGLLAQYCMISLLANIADNTEPMEKKMKKKMEKREFYEELMALFADHEDIVEFCEHELKNL